jgi:hypothetical protein
LITAIDHAVFRHGFTDFHERLDQFRVVTQTSTFQIFFQFRRTELSKSTLCSAQVAGELIAADLLVCFNVSSPLLGGFLPGFNLLLLDHWHDLGAVQVDNLLRLLIGQVQFTGDRLELLQSSSIKILSFGWFELVFLRRAFLLLLFFFARLFLFWLITISRFFFLRLVAVGAPIAAGAGSGTSTNWLEPSSRTGVT